MGKTPTLPKRCRGQVGLTASGEVKAARRFSAPVICPVPEALVVGIALGSS